jgi:hypothetical protein
MWVDAAYPGANFYVKALLMTTPVASPWLFHSFWQSIVYFTEGENPCSTFHIWTAANTK